MKRVLIVDDHPLVRAGLRELLRRAGFTVAGEASSAAEAERRARDLGPELVIWDWALPDGGMEALARFLKSFPGVRVLVVSAFLGPELACALREMGARGAIAKTAAPGELLQAVKAIAQGEEAFPEAAYLSAREREVLALLGKGWGNAEIAERLGISVKTVEGHLERLKRKLGCPSTAALRALAIKEVTDEGRWESRSGP
ncbi:response regulator transcription factor [Candidatus Bipolaricaulota bacterium]|nr:response regulator transcription factor [Candidatus Bipolaricaulota bacterium]